MRAQRKQTGKYARLEARVTLEQKRLIEQAAQLKGANLTDFIVSTMQRTSLETISEYQQITLREEDAAAFSAALINPPRPEKKLREAAKRYMRETERN